MKTLMKSTLLLAFALSTTLAFAGGEESRALQTTEEIKSTLINEISGLDAAAVKIKDAIVDITFQVDSEGKLIVTSIESDSHEAEAYVKQTLRDLKLTAASHLSNKQYALKVRYVKL